MSLWYITLDSLKGSWMAKKGRTWNNLSYIKWVVIIRCLRTKMQMRTYFKLHTFQVTIMLQMRKLITLRKKRISLMLLSQRSQCQKDKTQVMITLNWISNPLTYLKTIRMEWTRLYIRIACSRQMISNKFRRAMDRTCIRSTFSKLSRRFSSSETNWGLWPMRRYKTR